MAGEGEEFAFYSRILGCSEKSTYLIWETLIIYPRKQVREQIKSRPLDGFLYELVIAKKNWIFKNTKKTPIFEMLFTFISRDVRVLTRMGTDWSFLMVIVIHETIFFIWFSQLTSLF